MSLTEHSAGDSIPIETRRPSDYRSFYCNHAQCTFTAFDVSIMMSQALLEDKKLMIEQRAQVTLSLAEAKIVERILHNTIVQWEQKFGTISVPPDSMPDLVSPENEVSKTDEDQ